MGQRSKQTFLQRRHTDGQQTHEKMLNITHFREMQIIFLFKKKSLSRHIPIFAFILKGRRKKKTLFDFHSKHVFENANRGLA